MNSGRIISEFWKNIANTDPFDTELNVAEKKSMYLPKMKKKTNKPTKKNCHDIQAEGVARYLRQWKLCIMPGKRMMAIKLYGITDGCFSFIPIIG